MIPGFIVEQPATIERCVSAVRAFVLPFARDQIQGVALTGSGSSLNALTLARPTFLRAGVGGVVVHEPEDFAAEVHAGQAKHTLTVVLSQSGASASSVAAVEAAQHSGSTTLALTSSRGSPLGLRAAQVLEMPIGPEPVGPKTKGFLGSVAALLALAERLGAELPRAPTADAIAPLISPAQAAAFALAAELGSVDVMVFAGRRASYGIALEASLKIAEMAGVPCAAFPTEELLHGRLHGLTSASLVFMICDSAPEIAEAQHVKTVMARHGCRVLVVSSCGQNWPQGYTALEGAWNSLGLTIPFQWLAVALAERRGLRPETMRYGSLSRDLAIKLELP